jgi:hypothetical protein
MAQRDFLVQDDDISNVAGELAKAADISEDQAHRVLKALHIDKLNENLEAVQEIANNEKAVNALGWSQSTAREVSEVLTRGSFSLENLRVGIKPSGMVGIIV